MVMRRGESHFVCVCVCPLSSSSKLVAAKWSGWEGERGNSPGAAESLLVDSQGDELGTGWESLAIFYSPYPCCASRGLGHPRGWWTPGVGANLSGSL